MILESCKLLITEKVLLHCDIHLTNHTVLETINFVLRQTNIPSNMEFYSLRERERERERERKRERQTQRETERERQRERE